MDNSTYPQPFNPQPAKFKPGQQVINKHGDIGTICGPEDFDGYKKNRPSDKWELVQYPQGRRWVGNIWIKPQEKLDA